MSRFEDLYTYRQAKALANRLEAIDTSILGWNHGYLLIARNLLDMGEKMLLGEDVSGYTEQFNDLFEEFASQGIVWDPRDFTWKDVEDTPNSEKKLCMRELFNEVSFEEQTKYEAAYEENEKVCNQEYNEELLRKAETVFGESVSRDLTLVMSAVGNDVSFVRTLIDLIDSDAAEL